MGGRGRGGSEEDRSAGGTLRSESGVKTRGSRFINVEGESRVREGRSRNVSLDELMESNVEPGEQFDAGSTRGSIASVARQGRGNRELAGGGQVPSQVRTEQVEGRGSVGVNEFDIGTKMTEIIARIRAEAGKIMKRLEGQGVGLEDLKMLTKEGLNAMVESVEAVMSVVGDGVRTERNRRDEEDHKMEVRMGRLEVQVKENVAMMEAAGGAREKLARKESVQIMEERIKLANRQLKYVDIDFGRQTNNRREIVEKTIAYMREDVNLADRKRFDILLRRTKIIVLGKGTTTRIIEDQVVHNVPILLEMKSEADKFEIADILRAVNWYSVYHWPGECVEFVKEVRSEVRRLGYEDHRFYVKIRPEEREGRMQIKAEVKDRAQGARFKLVAVWGVPPADKALWGNETKPYRSFGRLQGGN